MRMLRVLALAAALPLAASAAEDVQVQEATGQAAVLNGDKPAAREKAIDDALRQAVKMAVGTQVRSSRKGWTGRWSRSRCARR